MGNKGKSQNHGEEKGDLNQDGDNGGASSSSPYSEEEIEQPEVEYATKPQEIAAKVSKSYRTFRRFIYSARNLIGSILARLLFLAVALFCIGLAITGMIGDNVMASYFLLIPLPLFFVEALITLKFRANTDFKWGTPCIFILLICSIPTIWLLELQYFQLREENKKNITAEVECKSDFKVNVIPNITISDGDLTNLLDTAQQFCLCKNCPLFMEQVLLLMLVVGRWIMPKAKGLTGDLKAQLLLTNIAVASDILDVFELLESNAVQENYYLMIAVLTVWSVSLLQFGIVQTALAEKGHGWCMIFESEMWALLTLLFLDDLMFLILRVVCVAHFNALSYSTYFFIAKNILILIFDVNRIISLATAEHQDRASQRAIHVSHLRR